MLWDEVPVLVLNHFLAGAHALHNMSWFLRNRFLHSCLEDVSKMYIVEVPHNPKELISKT